jgi:enoyl-CoA hydratase/carnithine racemase
MGISGQCRDFAAHAPHSMETDLADSPLLFEVHDQIAVMTLNRPDKLNALTDELCLMLLDAFAQVENNPDILVSVLQANGKSFCSGADMSQAPDPSHGPIGILQHRIYTENGIRRFKPVVGAVQGYALGAGAFLAFQGCDIVVAGDSARFGFPEGRAGFAIPPVTTVPYLPLKTSLEFLLLGWKGAELFEPARALAAGMINKVVPDAELREEAMRYARNLCLVPPGYVRAIKAAHYPAALSPASQAELNFIEHIKPQRDSGNIEELRASFAEKRAPRFKG